MYRPMTGPAMTICRPMTGPAITMYRPMTGPCHNYMPAGDGPCHNYMSARDGPCASHLSRQTPATLLRNSVGPTTRRQVCHTYVENRRRGPLRIAPSVYNYVYSCGPRGSGVYSYGLRSMVYIVMAHSVWPTRATLDRTCSTKRIGHSSSPSCAPSPRVCQYPSSAR